MLEFCNGSGLPRGWLRGSLWAPGKNEKPGMLEKKRGREVVQKQTGAGNAACGSGKADQKFWMILNICP
ncbi:hypothetical protein AYX07_05635 [Thermoactinomyces sp. AS95]|jgi:hypothetical protein|nr:hypothetical protein AYX07_05635 [Thermoactinomyces sp. AS95]